MGIDLSSVEPYEICSIRPPTENYSLTFKLTRNCYWNKCAFCPVYKLGARFSKRTIEEVKEDIRRAALIDEVLQESLARSAPFAGGVGGNYGEIASLIERIKRARERAGRSEPQGESPQSPPADLDPVLVWFSSWFKHCPTIEDSVTHVLSWRLGGGKTCFLGDADSMVVKPELMAEALSAIRARFPTLERFTVYGKTRAAARLRTVADLRALRAAGLHRIHFGLESGSDTVLAYVNKGSSRAEHIEACRKTVEAGLSCSVYVMPGLGGARWSEEHAHQTAEVLSRISPDYVRLRSLQIFPQTPLSAAADNGQFEEADEQQVVREIRTLIEKTTTETEILSDSAANLLNVNGRLPRDREAMLRQIDAYLELDRRERLVFDLQSRLRSFIGQYGGLSEEILQALSRHVSGSRLDLSAIPDTDLKALTRMIRARLMP
jgi:radical SAM superfamily enzyme YgiQ (UPF0313 family)